MFENITPEAWIAIAAAGGAILVGYVCYIAAYVQHKKEKQFAEQSARIEGTELPSFEIEKVSRWFHGYSLALVAEVVIAAVLGWVVAEYVATDFLTTKFPVWSIAMGSAMMTGLAVDHYIIHPIADGVFFEKVEKPLIEDFLAPKVEDTAPEMTGDKLEELKKLLRDIVG